MKEITVSVPGKIHLIGEHTVVYNRPAVIAAINKRCVVKIHPRKDKKIKISSKNYKHSIEIELNELFEKSQRARSDWEEFIKTKDISFLTRITKSPLDYPMLAVGEALKFYKISDLKEGLSLTIDSKIPVGAGCGSSAAIAVAVACAITIFLGKKLSKEDIFKIAVSTEELKHGTPSGGDPATVLYGGLVWFQKHTDGSKTIKPLKINISKKISENFYLIDTGKPEETTGEMIAIVRELKDSKPKDVEKIFDEQEVLTKNLLTTLELGDSVELENTIKKGEKNLERLGVVSDFVQNLIREIELSGGAAKISGGGGKTRGTGMLLVYNPSGKDIDKIVQSHHLQLSQIALGAEGINYGSAGA